MKVINTVVYDANPYNRLVYGPPGGRYSMVPGSIADAILALADGNKQILHLHWEEAVFRDAPSEQAADEARRIAEAGLRAFVAMGGRLIWTIHNAMPHEGAYPEVFLAFRASLSGMATRIIVHNEATVATLADQTRLDRAKIVRLAHPSYLGVYEDEADTLFRQPDWDSRRLLFIGMLRPYKGLDLLVEAMHLAPDIACDIVGEPQATGAAFDDLRRRIETVTGARLDARRAADGELPGLLRAGRGVVLPYRRFLTSGIALLAMTFGRPIIAPDLPQMREILPPSARSLLYTAGDAASLAGKMRLLMTMDLDDQQRIHGDLLARAREYAPARISDELFALFDSLD